VSTLSGYNFYFIVNEEKFELYILFYIKSVSGVSTNSTWLNLVMVVWFWLWLWFWFGYGYGGLVLGASQFLLLQMLQITTK